MTHKLIKTDNYLLVLENPYTILCGDWIFSESKLFGPILFNGQTDYEKSIVSIYWSKVIAHLPLNDSPILEGVDLLPPYSRHQEDGLDELAQEWVFDINGHKWSNNDDTGGDNYGSFKAGYNKAKEKYKYTEKDMVRAIDMARDLDVKDGLTDYKYSIKDILEFHSDYPTEFECEMEPYTVGEMSSFPRRMFGTVDYKPKTITTAQGIQWVGVYKK
jgi:hypothetical protein